MLSRRAGLSATAGHSCYFMFLVSYARLIKLVTLSCSVRVKLYCRIVCFGALQPGFPSLASVILVVNIGKRQPKTTAAASRDFLAAARLSCY